MNNNFRLIENYIDSLSFPSKTKLQNLIYFMLNLMTPISKVVMKKENLVLKLSGLIKKLSFILETEASSTKHFRCLLFSLTRLK